MEAAAAHQEQVKQLQAQLKEAEEAQRWVVVSMRAVDGTWEVEG